MDSSNTGLLGHLILKASGRKMDIPMLNTVIILFIIYLCYSVIRRLRIAYFSPLSRIPGPWYAHLTGLVLRYHILNGNRVNYVQSLHEKYGPFVRIAHNEVVTCDAAATKEIHAIGTNWRKWSHIPDDITPNIFSIVDPKQHSIRQRFYRKFFQQATLRKTMEPAVLSTAETAIKGMKKDADAAGNIVNVHEWFMLFSNDIMSLLTFGEGFGLMDKGERKGSVMTPVELHKMNAWLELSLPIFLLGRFVLSHFSERMRAIFRADVALNPSEDKAIAQLRMGEKDEEGRTVFARAIEDAKEDEMLKFHGKTRLTDDEIAADALGFQLAGAEPVGVSLTYLIWCILRHPDVQRQIEMEVAGVELSDAALEKLPILTAAILESLRLWGGNATAMRRREDITDGGVLLGGLYLIPKGTIVSTQAYSLHRNPDNWKDPFRWDHKRWLDPAQSHSISTDRFQPFSAGSRMCAAYHLALMEIRIMTAIFFKTFPGARLAPSVTPESMALVDRFNLFPKHDSCEVILSGQN
ncbi:cytochrome P450, putative [Talaromyces stipitatus ATCC 10500]|uniref:Cytochrome P450, putative n=2 Tax=Talaromyces stipitatus TaxID=28564 RepID=B8LZ58_TALSN|nr:cytochrome P450, putative [Talaromyces stipitatus ATCC 10500]AWS21684.1 cytochrome P450 [Talaromyces stipitatus]EED21102.1 cytochrome P450, putative [Talaromyces stipitatus ATCC 10500]